MCVGVLDEDACEEDKVKEMVLGSMTCEDGSVIGEAVGDGERRCGSGAVQ